MNEKMGYNGNPLVKKAGIQHEFTPDQVRELAKCATDVVYFVENYCKIITLDSGLQLFKPFEYQVRMLETFEQKRFVINLLPRQMGKCVRGDTKIKVRNKKTGKIVEMKIGDFHKMTNKNAAIKNGFTYDVVWSDDNLDEKFIESFDVSEWEIETDTGWEDISHSHKTIVYDEWELLTESGKTLVSADDHILFDHQGNEIYVRDCVSGSSIITKDGIEKVISVNPNGNSSHMYDLSVNSENHRYYTNGILSHNSTVVAAYLLHYAMFNDEKTVGILANKAATSREILSRIQRMYEHLPLWMQTGVKEWNKGSMILANDSKILAAATSSDSIRGLSINIIYLDEFAHVNQQIEFWESTYPVISSGESSKVIITSTPNGMELFHKIYKEAEEGKNNFTPIKVHWSEHPKRDQKWKEETLRNIGLEQFKQEFDVEFVGSSGTLITGDKLQMMSVTDPILQSEGLYQFARPIPGHTYAMFVDVSRGKGLDYSAFSVIDITEMPYKQVCTFRDNMVGSVDYASTVHRVAKIYNEAYVLVEINDIGGQVSDVLYMDYGYENLIFTENGGRSGKRVSGGFGKNVDRGVRTTKSVKAIGCSILKMLIEQDQLIINDHYTFEELKRFSKKANSYEAESGSHDDMVMGLVLFAWLTDQLYFKDLTDINTMLKLREKTEDQLDEDLLPFGFISDGSSDNDIIAEYNHDTGSWM